MLLGFEHTQPVRHRTTHNQQMHYLVAVAHDIVPSWSPSLWYPGGICHRTRAMTEAECEIVGQAHSPLHLAKPKETYAVNDGQE